MMKLTFEHGLDDFAHDNSLRPAPGEKYRDTGIEFWLDGELVQSVAKNTNRSEEEQKVASRLQDKIMDLLINEGRTKVAVRDYLRSYPPAGVEV